LRVKYLIFAVVAGPQARNARALNTCWGAYGLRIRGIEDAQRLMQELPDDAPSLTVHVHAATGATSQPVALDEAAARLALVDGGVLTMEKASGDAHFHLRRRPPDEDLLHPYLAPAAALYWHWRGRQALHAGAVRIGDGAVLLMGPKESGKSTTLGWLALHGGRQVLADDLAVVHDGQVLAGPRSLDLRPGGVLAVSGARPARGGERNRVALDTASDAPLVGIAVLDWAPQIAMEGLSFEERIAVISANRCLPSMPVDPLSMLDLATVPFVRACRPRDLGQLEAFATRLIEQFSV
jgi:hypothetical protein